MVLNLNGQGDAVRLIDSGKAPRVVQWEGGATYDQMWQKSLAQVVVYRLLFVECTCACIVWLIAYFFKKFLRQKLFFLEVTQ